MDIETKYKETIATIQWRLHHAFGEEHFLKLLMLGYLPTSHYERRNAR